MSIRAKSALYEFYHLLVCPLAHLRNREAELYQFSVHVACGLLPWLCPPLVAFAMRYVFPVLWMT